MSTSMIGAAGGLSAVDREKLIPENLREGVTLFEGTSKEVVGSLVPFGEGGLELLAWCSRSGNDNAGFWYWDGNTYGFSGKDNVSRTIVGTPKWLYGFGGAGNYTATVCGINMAAAWTLYESGFAGNVITLRDPGMNASFVLLGTKQ